MKHIKSIILGLSLIIMISLGITNVKADINDTELVKDRFPDIYGVFDGYEVFFGQRYIMNGETAYCIEPGVAIDTFTYSSTNNWDITGLSSDIIRRVRLFAYYGYDYPSHQTPRYFIASQELIWEAITGKTTYWVTENRADGPRIDISYEKNEILNLVNNHSTKPSFNENTINVNLGETITLTDSNGVLNNYDIYSTNLENISIDNNTLKITADSKVGEQEILLLKKTYTNKITLIYYNGSNQKLASNGILDPSTAKVKINTTGGTITAKKIDSQTGGTPQGEATLNGAKYGIYNTNNELVDTLITGTNNTSKILPYGTYNIKELEASKGYELSSKVETVVINDNNPNPTVNLFENVIKQKYTFYKVFATDASTILKVEKNVKFDVYSNATNKLFTSFTTDENGFASIELPYGTYIVKQITTTPNFKKVDDFEIIVNKHQDKAINTILSDAEITARLKVIKIDADTGKVIKRSNIKFKIKDVSTNKYVCQTITYPSNQEICEYSTNENGEFTTPYPLSSGKYLLEEVDQKIDGYLWNNESVSFEIGENAELITDENGGILFETKFTNKAVRGIIKINKLGEKLILEGNNFHYDNIKLDNIVYELYASSNINSSDGTLTYKANELIGTYKTDKNGLITIKNLPLGKYYIVEKETKENYIIDEKKYNIELRYKDQYTEIVEASFEHKNYLKKGTIELSKTDLIDGEVIPNTKLAIYTEDNKKVFEGITDENGKLIIENLSVGKYYIIETEPATGYVITDEIVYFEIKSNGEIVKAEMKNKPILGTLIFTKLDISTSEPLPNTLIEIYDAGTDSIIESKRTDELGQVIIENLRYGKYYILEKEAPEGYTLNEEKMYFEITNDGEIIKATMVDERIIIEVPITGINDNHLIEIIGLVLLIGGIGVFAYEKKKRK